MKKVDRAKALLASAVETLKSGQSSFNILPWRDILNTQSNKVSPQFIGPMLPVVRSGRRATDNLVVPALPQMESTMTKANAKEKSTALKAATKAAAAKGITALQHQPATPTTPNEGVDTEDSDVVKSGFPSINQLDSSMTKTPTPAAAKPATPVNAETRAASDEKIKADLAARAKAKADAEEAKKIASAEKAKKLEEATAKRTQEALDRKAAAEARAAKANETKEQREARIAALTAEGRTYTGSMLALADRVKAGVYVKSMTGQLRSTDELAVALDAVPAENVVKLGMLVFGEANKYAALNIGQQSMNYRNRIRGAIKNGKVKLGDDVITLDLIKKLRDDNGFATGEAMAAEKAKAKEAREAKAKEALEAKAKKDALVKEAAEKKAADAKAAAEAKAAEAAAKPAPAKAAKGAAPAGTAAPATA